ncbi:MAG: hypothetical protein HC876_13580 [Chloroflexaceae bacterium]|nr:hypothetical protein [Chloroflexaceae bacterium]
MMFYLRNRLILIVLVAVVLLQACAATDVNVPETNNANTSGVQPQVQPTTPSDPTALPAAPDLATPQIVPTAPPRPAQNEQATGAVSTELAALVTATPEASTPTNALPVIGGDTPTPAPVVTVEPTATPTPVRTNAGSEILFLRNGVLTAYAFDGGQERSLLDGVREFAATPDGRQLAAVRETDGRLEIWVLGRDGSGARRLTTNQRYEGDLAWAPDGLTLIYASSSTPYPELFDWEAWTAWCRTSEVRLIDLSDRLERLLDSGCDPVFSPDGRRIAYVTPPQAAALETQEGIVGSTNAVRLVNRQGQNGWNFATAGTGDDTSGLLVYAPAWSPDGAQLAYQRFVGYRALTDIGYTEMGGSFQGGGELLNLSLGWTKAPHFAPTGEQMATIQYNFSDARGLSGYAVWTVQVLALGQSSEVFAPSGTLETEATVTDSLYTATGAAWSPDATQLVVALPGGWNSGAPLENYQSTDTGTLWLWQPGSTPSTQLVEGVDFGSPLLWLPAA